MQDRLQLAAGWQMCATSPGTYADPQALLNATHDWIATSVPSTAASALRAAGSWSLDGPARCFDAEDWWYRLTFSARDGVPHGKALLGFDGLATVADAWLNGHAILSSDNMFVAHQCMVGQLLTASNELVIRFRALDELLKAKRPRPRWRAPMIGNQQLRWFRTTVLGRTPGWSPPCAAVGPWRDIWLELQPTPTVSDIRYAAVICNDDGVVRLNCQPPTDGAGPFTVELQVSGHGVHLATPLALAEDGRFRGEVRVHNPMRWWPHTHGEPALYQVALRVTNGEQVPVEYPLGSVGFRTMELDTEDGNFKVLVNGTRIFCRGACWTPLDAAALHAEPSGYDLALTQVRDAGMNMLRVGGTMIYESDAFYDRCDALGILVWQDFMFANMDYPDRDASFVESVKLEASQILARLCHRPSVAVLCGNSEVEQQAAMWGAPRERWSPELFHGLLRNLAAKHCPDVPYWPSSAHGGAFPHQGDSGTTSYYGVGAYLRPLEDARRAELRFATECLAFANVPEAATIQKMPAGLATRVHHPGWKERSPRDLGAGWDFDDVRDHYLAQLFKVEPLKLRYSDHERYLALSRATVDYVMTSAFSEWRRQRSTCNGALIWFLRDLWPGAGWGLIGSDSIPKSPYYALRRALQPVSLSISDEGTNGLSIHVTNEHTTALEAALSIKLYREGEFLVGEANRTIRVPPTQALQMMAGELFDEFRDLSYAYRFGPTPCDLVIARLLAADNSMLCETHHLPLGPSAHQHADIGLVARAIPRGNNTYELTIQSRKCAHSVTVTVDGFACDDQYFSLPPVSERKLTLRALKNTDARPPWGTVQALNLAVPVVIELQR